MAAPDEITLTVGGQEYWGWHELRATTHLKRGAADFDIGVSEAWELAAIKPWQIAPGASAVLALGGKPIVTGYVDEYAPSYGGDSHKVRIAGRSKTCDLVDCMPEITGGQFVGYTLDAVARAICQPFGIGVVVQAPMGDPLVDTTFQRCEAAWEFLETFARQRAVLLTDDENGNLVLTRTSNSVSPSRLVEGQNIVAAEARLSMAKRWSKYLVRAQMGLNYDNDGEVQTDVLGTATDPGVPRYRPRESMAGGQMDDADAAAYAQWEALHYAGESTLADITVVGWTDAAGNPWRKNVLIGVTAPRLALDRQLLIAGVEFTLDETRGKRTKLSLAPPEAFTPEPIVVPGAGVWNNVKGVGQ
jgi:prophage tail gpP-like protein